MYIQMKIFRMDGRILIHTNHIVHCFNGTVSSVDNPELIFTRGQNIGGERIKDMVIHQLPSVAKGWNTHGMTQKQVDAYYMNTGDDCPGMNSQYAGYQAYKDRVDNRPRPVGYTSKRTGL